MADLSSILKQQYASAIEQELAGLKKAYEQNTLAVDTAEKALPEQYETQRNSLAATNALERKAFDERAMATGLNTGTSGQAALARSNTYQRGLADIGAAQIAAQNEIDLKRATLKADYENAMAEAKARNDAALNAALYAELVRQQELAAAQAAAAAKAAGGGGNGGGGGTVSSYAPTITVNKAAESAKGSGTTSFSNVQRTISAALQTGDFNKASNLAGGVWAQATTNQRNDLKTLFERNGYSIDN